jgi:glycosyltransferase involved in cell wall biosynthesis
VVKEISDGEVEKIWCVSGVFPKDNHSQNRENLEFLGTFQNMFSPFMIPAKLNEILQFNESLQLTLVCGDYFKSFLQALIIRRRYPNRVRIQIQFHGDFYRFRRRSSLRLYAQSILARLAVIAADSIRVVSLSQESEIKRKFPKNSIQFVYSPVPIDFSKISSVLKDSQKHQIAFVGRLHEERGIKLFSQIAAQLIQQNGVANIVIAGSGPEEEWLKNRLEAENVISAIEFRGELTGVELLKLYGESRILISTAPYESYGLSIREAALSGLYVAALDSSGVREAILDFPDLIGSFETLDQAVRLISELLNRPRPKSLDVAIRRQIIRDREACYRLAESWISA